MYRERRDNEAYGVPIKSAPRSVLALSCLRGPTNQQSSYYADRLPNIGRRLEI